MTLEMAPPHADTVQGQRFTVLGASGFIGRHLVASLRRAGHDVVALARGDQSVYKEHLGHAIYCIGMTADFRARPFDTARSHVSVLADVLESARFDSLLYLSSTRVYARSAKGSESECLVCDVADRSDLYNLTKLTGEALCRSCGRAGVRVARLSNVVGHDTASENFLSALIREALSGRIELQSDPRSAKDYILIDDVMSLLPRIACEGREWLYNVASGVNITHREVADRLIMLTGCRVEVRAEAPLSRFPAIDNERIRAEFGYSPSSVLEALPDLVTKYQAEARLNT